jgi:hypothetical protein
MPSDIFLGGYEYMNNRAKAFLSSIYIIFFIFIMFLYNSYEVNSFPKEIIFFIFVLFILVNLSMLYNYKSNISTAIFLPALIPAIVIFNPFWTTIIAFFGSMNFLKIRNNSFIWYKFLFNRIMISLSAGMAAILNLARFFSY